MERLDPMDRMDPMERMDLSECLVCKLCRSFGEAFSFAFGHNTRKRKISVRGGAIFHKVGSVKKYV
ncbi:hypothetical protein [Cohnella lupini]|uniref:Uncharacterized protein n=1 Tax=Cohnella lupini TaxID=1294267 RepID=A0A3D9I604_9BACL|nr:hypothetical protein [Cohnella lupini]RED57090.1 hypothetical protein DFP95_1111 [Cohnella lupini]